MVSKRKHLLLLLLALLVNHASYGQPLSGRIDACLHAYTPKYSDYASIPESLHNAFAKCMLEVESLINRLEEKSQKRLLYEEEIKRKEQRDKEFFGDMIDSNEMPEIINR